MVSFFPRRGNEFDKFLSESITVVVDANTPTEAETHTIALWKTGPEEITIIDPTDKTFSQFLREILEIKYQGIKFRIENTNIEGVEGKIYKPKHHNFNKKQQELVNSLARDCTDIAVKIAFELNERQTNLEVDTVDLVLFGTIEQISNANLPKEIGLFSALQSSDFNIRKAAKELIDTDTTTDSLILKTLDITKVTTLEEIQEVSTLCGALNIEDILMN